MILRLIAVGPYRIKAHLVCPAPPSIGVQRVQYAASREGHGQRQKLNAFQALAALLLRTFEKASSSLTVCSTARKTLASIVSFFMPCLPRVVVRQNIPTRSSPTRGPIRRSNANAFFKRGCFPAERPSTKYWRIRSVRILLLWLSGESAVRSLVFGRSVESGSTLTKGNCHYCRLGAGAVLFHRT
jgi:hypothetical protein